MHFLSCIASENVCGMRRTLLCEATMWHFRYILKLVFPHSSNDSTCKCTRKKKHTMDRKSMGAPEHWFYKGFDHFNQNQTWLTHTHTTGTTKTHSILHRPAPQIRWHWASPSPFALFGTPKTAQPMYTPISPLSPTNHHNQKQNMPLPSKMNKIHIKSLNSQHIEWKWYKSHSFGTNHMIFHPKSYFSMRN